jgi:hypothetical protein
MKHVVNTLPNPGPKVEIRKGLNLERNVIFIPILAFLDKMVQVNSLKYYVDQQLDLRSTKQCVGKGFRMDR